ncbi:hypothetical protein Daus18300_007132 [Diaporthe australafricana]|uniref:Extracellular membrane protein CFEM domain-containing protein n=1 Tax=Diaporthe australafricana TaxID=127596 RepID=A0ABR3WPB9_9PEZI
MLPTTLRNALLSVAALLPTHVLADDDDSSDVVTFQFSACAGTCLAKTGYSMDGEDNQKDMCKASRDGLLEAIMACMVSQCIEDLSAVDANLLQPMQAGCKELEKPVSDDEIGDAASAAANIIQATAGPSTSTTTATSSSSIGMAVTISAAPLSFEPLGVETETSTATDLLTTSVPAETPAAVDAPAETATLVSAESTTSGTGIYQPEAAVPAETQASTPEAAIASGTPPAPDPATSAEATSMSAAAAIVPVAQLTHSLSVQPNPEATALAELAPSDPVPNPQAAPTSTSTSASDHANQIRPDTTPDTTSSTTVFKPTSTHEGNVQGQQTTATGQAPDNSAVAGVTSTSTTEASKTEGSRPKATTEADNDDNDTSSSSATTSDISGELVLATGTPSASGFATSITAVAASPSASGSSSSQTAAEDSDAGVGGGSPFSVVMASAAAPNWSVAPRCVIVAAVVGTLVSLMNL